MYKKKLAILFFIVANIVMLVHLIVPHHHHKEEICVVAENCSHSCEIDEHQAIGDAQEHQSHYCTEDCLLKQAYTTPTQQIHQPRVSISYEGHLLAQSLILLYINPIKSISFFSPPEKDFPIQFKCSSYFQFVNTATGLRAPPCV